MKRRHDVGARAGVRWLAGGGAPARGAPGREPTSKAERARTRARRRAPTPAPAPRRRTRPPKPEEKPTAGHLRRGDARHGLPDEAERPELVRRGAADEAAVLRRPVRRGRPLLRRRPSEPPRVQGLHADEPGRAQDDLRVRAVRHRRRRRPDDVPPAPRLGRARPDRGGPDVEPVHGPRRLPELDRVLGAERDGLLPQRAVPVDAVAEGRLELHDRARAAGGQRRPGCLRGAHRARGREGPLPAPGPLGALPQGGRLGPRPGGRHAARDQVGRPERRPVRPRR